MTKKKKSEPIILSREDQIASVLRKNDDLAYKSPMFNKPEHVVFRIGDEVEVGSLKDCVIAGISDDGNRVAIEYHDLTHPYGQIQDNGRVINEHCWDWYNVRPKAEIKQTQFTNKTVGGELLQLGGRRNSTLDALLFSVIRRGFWINQKYQRGYVWNDDDKTRLIDSIFKGVRIGEFVFIENTNKQDWTFEVLDGQQRLTTLVEFVLSKFKYHGYYWHEMSVDDRRTFDNFSVAWVELNGKYLDDKSKAEIFLLTNVAGVPQTDEHLSSVRKLLED